MKVNVEKLDRELRNADIPIDGVRGDGVIDFAKSVTKAHKVQAKAILDAHDPRDAEKEKRDAYRGAYSHDEFMEAYFELHHEGKPEKMEALQGKRVDVKKSFSKT